MFKDFIGLPEKKENKIKIMRLKKILNVAKNQQYVERKKRYASAMTEQALP